MQKNQFFFAQSEKKTERKLKEGSPASIHWMDMGDDWFKKYRKKWCNVTDIQSKCKFTSLHYSHGRLGGGTGGPHWISVTSLHTWYLHMLFNQSSLYPFSVCRELLFLIAMVLVDDVCSEMARVWMKIIFLSTHFEYRFRKCMRFTYVSVC